MKKIVSMFLLCAVIVSLGGCGGKTNVHAAPQSPAESAIPKASEVPADNAADTLAPADTAAPVEESIPPVTAAASANVAVSPTETPDEPYDDYPYDIAADRKKFDDTHIDITVGDKLYMTQINDWYTNFADYDGKSVVIEGYYMTFDNYAFVGRNGPSCPYCTGGYVNFELKSDEDLSSLVSESTWIKVTGILRQGTMYPGSGQPAEPFYYIEAMKVETMDQVGIDTVTD